MLSAFLKNNFISKQEMALILPYQSWEFANLSDVSFKSESGVESSSRQGPRWPHGVAEGQPKGLRPPAELPLPPGVISGIPRQMPGRLLQCLPQSCPISLLDLLRAVPSIPACTPRPTACSPHCPLNMPHSVLYSLCCFLHALCSTHVSFLPLLFF